MKNSKVDLTPFTRIPAQLSSGDKASFLTILDAHAALFGEYAYLEIGSHLGGSIAPVLMDARCKKIYSIDKRPLRQPDDTGKDSLYPGNSTERMMKNLREIDPAADSRVKCFDSDTGTLAVPEFGLRPSLCFIDGEHTDAVAFRDYQFCLKVIQDRGTLVFHDANTVYLTLQRIVDDIKQAGLEFDSYCLADAMFVISIGTPKLSSHPSILALLRQGGGYLPSLAVNDHFRRFKNRAVFRWVRGLRDAFR